MLLKMFNSKLGTFLYTFLVMIFFGVQVLYTFLVMIFFGVQKHN